jgi:hypothetical protein
MSKLTKAEQILELHLGSEFHVLQKHKFYRNIKNAMNEALNSTGVDNSTSLKEMLVDFGNVVKNSEGQEVELLADAYIVYDRIKDEKEQ